MGFLDKLLKKENNKQEEYKEEKPAKRIYQRLKEVSEVDYIRFELEEKETHIFDSKVGGAYYVPRDQNLPVNQKTGAPLYLLAQINFEQIPHIKDFPEKGLLQIFISGDDGVYGLNFDNEYSQSGWCLRYFEYSANRRPLVTVEKSTKYAEQVHFIKILNTLRSPL